MDGVETPYKPSSPATSSGTNNIEDEIGRDATIKDFYEGKYSGCDCCINWVEQKPTQISSATKAKFDEAAIRLYNVKDHDRHTTFGGLTSIRPRFVEIQSRHICRLLRPILHSLDKLTAEDDTISLEMPFAELYHNLDKIDALVTNLEKDSDARKHAELLPGLTDRLFHETITKAKKVEGSAITDFSLVWTLFPKGSIVFAKRLDCQNLFEVESVKYHYDRREQTASWRVLASYFAFSGKEFVKISATLSIPSFNGNIRVDELPVFPAKYHSDNNLIPRCISRGRQILEYQDVSYREYVGIAFERDPQDPRHAMPLHVNGRVVMDALKYNEENPALEPESKRIDYETTKTVNNTSFEILEDTTYEHGRSLFGKPKTRKSKDLKQRPSAEAQESAKATLSGQDQFLMLLCPVLFGYSLRDRKWLEFPIDGLSPIEWDKEAWKHLVYDQHKKDMIVTFVRDHSSSNTRSTDVIAGKGEGLIFLLSGPPGTGKTLTAEALASAVKRPFYHLGIMDLGTGAKELSQNLSKAFDLATEWNAVTLLDEADVFMAQRSDSSLLRNELVSIFLHELEYFRGVLFLTTNLLENIDNAFRSRIHLHLIYEPHGPPARRNLWETFLMKQPGTVRRAEYKHVECTLDSKDLDALALWRLNGREIKNIAKNVRAWCSSQGRAIDMTHVSAAIETTSPFTKRDGTMPSEERVLEG
ncbi:MAG: hypothetical protein M1831_002988 [Alyxoria varia]|nr:MAG: hypothetical protein M1831_002988 [Alyxoria varia]